MRRRGRSGDGLDTFQILTLVTMALLSVASFKVTVSAAGTEPFFHFLVQDALYYVGFTGILALLWVELGGMIAFLVWKRRWSGWWLLALAWVSCCVFGTWTAFDTWTSDMRDYVVR